MPPWMNYDQQRDKIEENNIKPNKQTKRKMETVYTAEIKEEK